MSPMRALPLVALSLLASASAVPALAQQAPAPAPTPAQLKPGEACPAGKFRDFDFWVGDWDVYGPKGVHVGSSRISKLLGDCVIDEHWKSAAGGLEGRSHNMYDSGQDRWTQFWVDNGGNTLLLFGGMQGGKMVLLGEQPDPKAGKVNSQRITWSREAGGIVRQLWETSPDGGKTWTIAFDGRYQKAGTPPPPTVEDAAKS